MKNTNKVIQIIAMIVLVFIGTHYFARNTDEAFFGLFVLAFFLGAYQLLVSLVHVICTLGHSPFRFHFIFSILYFVIMIAGGSIWDEATFEPWVQLFAYGVPSLLTVYFWYISFICKDPFGNRVPKKFLDVF